MNDLREIPLFRNLEDNALADLYARLTLRRYHRGDVVIREGEVGDHIYIIRSGQVEIISEGRIGRPPGFITHMGPGDYVGELGVLLDTRRSATVRVTIEAQLWELRKADLYELFAEYPSIGLAMSRELAKRLKQTNEPPQEDSINLIAVRGGETLCGRLASHLQRLTGEKIMLLDLGGMRPSQPEVPPQISVEQIDLQSDPNTLTHRLSQLVGQYKRVLMAIPPLECALTRKAAEQAKVVVELSQQPTNWVQNCAKNGSYWRYPPENRAISQVARRIARKRVGLALSSGNARSLAHIGVLRVLEEAGIPIDMIIGTSGGGLFGGLYAAGKSLNEITTFAKGLTKLYSVRSVSAINLLPRLGLVKGHRVQKVLDEQLGNMTFEQCKIPLQVIAADVMTGEEVVLRSGQIGQAIRATVSSTPLFEPVQINGRWLIDGAAVNPVPVRPLRDQVDIIIASSVIVPIEKRKKQAPHRLPNLLDLVFNKETIMEAGIIQNGFDRIDALIQPDIIQFSGFDFHRADDLIATGIAAAKPLIPKLKQMLEPVRF
ncbi:MAG: patatin-like phospholipase family protein [Ardenticatenaceae bacterium]